MNNLSPNQQDALQHLIVNLATGIATVRWEYSRGKITWNCVEWHNTTLALHLSIVGTFGPRAIEIYHTAYATVAECAAEPIKIGR